MCRLDRNVAGTGALGDLCAHLIDVATCLIGYIVAGTSAAETFGKQRPRPTASVV